MTEKGRRIAGVEGFRLFPKAVKEAWAEDDYVWPSTPPALLIRVTTEDGSFGIGEAASQVWYLGETAEQMETAVRYYNDALLGVDAHNIALCHRKMVATLGGGNPGGRSARSGVDMALHDLVGKAMGLPIHTLLGGAYRTSFDLLTNLYHKTPEAMAAACEDFIGRGFKGLKVKVGDVLLAEGWSRDNLLAELDKLDAAMAVTPRDVYVDADANQGWWSAQWTLSALERYRGHDNLSIEQPLPYDDIEGAALIRSTGHVPVILDESVWSPEALSNIVRRGACDRIVLKLNRVGGFFEARRTIAIAEAAGVGVSVDTNPYSLVGDTAVCHAAAICQNPYPVDCEGHVSFLSFGDEQIFSGGITFDGGRAHLPDAPGLGVEVDWDALARHQQQNQKS